jgi:hypothetical protein
MEFLLLAFVMLVLIVAVALPTVFCFLGERLNGAVPLLVANYLEGAGRGNRQ